MKKLFEVRAFHVFEMERREDCRVLQQLIETCSDYYELMSGEGPSEHEADEIYDDLPPGTRPDQKMILGVFDEKKQMVGMVDMIEDFHVGKGYFIGQFMIVPELRSQGLGAMVMMGLESWARAEGKRQLGLSVVEKNPNALRFWTSMGFNETQVKEVPIGKNMMKVFVMEKDID